MQRQKVSIHILPKICNCHVALLQFASRFRFYDYIHLLDMMKSLEINPSEFGLVVSSYAFSAAVSGMSAGFADQFR